MDSDSLVATRARRANAGSRLKQLIEIEEGASGARGAFHDDDDENVELLFQEDEDDDEFQTSEREDSGADEESENEDAEPHQDASPTENDDEDPASGAESVNPDEMLSDSDLSVSEDEDDEGEQELQKAEKALKRKRAKSVIPAVKKPKIAVVKAPKPQVNHSELLLQSERRASSRKSALKNKENLVQKLREEELRRAAFIPVVKKKERKLTQEERLAQAVETEKENVLSLHSFLEQEIVKKERQKYLFQQRRQKLRNVIRLHSRETFVSPLDEVMDVRHLQDLLEKRRRGRRRKFVYHNFDDYRFGDPDKDLPYYRKEVAERRLKEEQQAAEKLRIEKEREEKRRKLEFEAEQRRLKLEEERAARKLAKERRYKEFENVDITAGHPGPLPSAEDSGDPLNATSFPEESISASETPTIAEVKEEIPDSVKTLSVDTAVARDSESHLKLPIDPPMSDVEASETKNVEQADDATPDTPVSQNVDPQHEEVLENASEASPIEALATSDREASATPVLDTKKKVTFAEDTPDAAGGSAQDENGDGTPVEDVKEDVQEDAVDEEPEIEEESVNFYPVSEDGWVYEGPVQHVSRNYVILMDFDGQENFDLTEREVKKHLFGANANVHPSRRFKDVETIMKSSLRLDNPYQLPKEEKEDDLMKPVTEITEEDPIFDVLRRLPRLGVKDTEEEEEIDLKAEETTEVKIKTEAPMGLYLPNENKKLCLISGKEVRYFDPLNGIPYENKQVYQVIKKVELGAYPWCNIDKDQNNYGAVEIYLSQRDGPHAKGVPEGFDGF